MFLKRLELHGFKSFPEKIRLDFPPGITAVVGPNGSGKSNIADAVRWVMGEQSAKSLRGSKMEDIIFAGTAHRKPLGYAEVSMHIDNAEGLLATPFAEVKVTRRVYRSGESEFQINGAACRLKDIHMLFMDTGVGKEGYSIIGQGKVDEILSSRSEDRRRLFEEAAGIAKYKSRRAETLNKLEAERANLERAEVLIGELAAQLPPLAEQARKAEKYLALREHYKKIHINLFLTEADKLEAQHRKNEQALEDLQHSAELEKARHTETQSALTAIKAAILAAEESDRAANQEQLALATAIEKAESAVKLHLVKQEHAQESLERHTAQARTLQTALTALQSEETAALVEQKKQYSGLNRDYFGSVKAVMQKAHSDTDFGSDILGVVSELAEIRAGYEHALSVALGGAAQNIVTATEEAAGRAIRFLKRQQAGRATFLPLTAMRARSLSGESAKLLSEESVLGTAADFVRHDRKFDALFSQLLGNIFVADNFTNATALSKKYRYRYRIVTLEGELFSPGGAISGGSKKSGRRDNIENLLREQQQKELARISREKSAATAQLSATQQEQRVQTEEIARLAALIEEQRGELAALRERYAARQTPENSGDLAKLRDAQARAESDERTAYELLQRLQSERERLQMRMEHDKSESLRLYGEIWEQYELTYQTAQSYRDECLTGLRQEERRAKTALQALGNVNLGAPEAYANLKTRHELLAAQRDDIRRAEQTLQQIIEDLTEKMRKQFLEQLGLINTHFNDVFREMFGGGSAGLTLKNPEMALESGIDITARPPGKNLQSLSLMSGGERALTAIALLFGILRMKPSPFCVLDEIEAALDDTNVTRFAEFLKRYEKSTQFVLITHRKGTMEYADTLYGVTMQEIGVSAMVSVDFR